MAIWCSDSDADSERFYLTIIENLLPMPSSQSLYGKLPEETARAWMEFGTQYVPEYSNSAAPAMVTLASAGLSAVDQDVVEDVLRYAESLLDNVDDLEGARGHPDH